MVDGTAEGDDADEGSSKKRKVVQILEPITGHELIQSSHSVHPLPKPLPPNLPRRRRNRLPLRQRRARRLSKMTKTNSMRIDLNRS